MRRSTSSAGRSRLPGRSASTCRSARRSGWAACSAERADAQAAEYATEAIELCRRAGTPQQLAATLPTAAMVCWQVGELDLARQYVAEAMPLLADSRRIARVVLLSVAAGIALADLDLDAAIELGEVADTEATDLGIERELPLIRCVLARALLDRGDDRAAAAKALDAVLAAKVADVLVPDGNLPGDGGAGLPARRDGVGRAGESTRSLASHQQDVARCGRHDPRGRARPGPVTLSEAVEPPGARSRPKWAGSRTAGNLTAGLAVSRTAGLAAIQDCPQR